MFLQTVLLSLIRILQLLEALDRSRQLRLRLRDDRFSALKPTLRYLQVNERALDVGLKTTVRLAQNVDKGLTLIEIEPAQCAPEILKRALKH
jgi:hypothetical protein